VTGRNEEDKDLVVLISLDCLDEFTVERFWRNERLYSSAQLRIRSIGGVGKLHEEKWDVTTE